MNMKDIALFSLQAILFALTFIFADYVKPLVIEGKTEKWHLIVGFALGMSFLIVSAYIAVYLFGKSKRFWGYDD